MRRNHEAIRNEWFHEYLNKVQKINSEYKGSLHQWLQGVFFELDALNASPVNGTDIARSVVYIGKEFPFLIDLSPSRLREGNS